MHSKPRLLPSPPTTARPTHAPNSPPLLPPGPSPRRPLPQGRIGDIGYTLVPLDKVDLSLVSILYMQGDMAAVTPVYTYAIPGEDGAMPEGSAFSGWRTLLGWLGPPGLVLAVLCLLTVDEPRAGASGFLGDPLKSSRFLVAGGGAMKQQTAKGGATAQQQRRRQQQQQQRPGASGGTARPAAAPAAAAPPAAAAAAAAPTPVAAGVGGSADRAGSIADSLAKLRTLLASPKFQAITFASAINDVGSWALVSWQATFYQRVYHLPPETYAPLLAVVIPIGGIIGGVGAGARVMGGGRWVGVGHIRACGACTEPQSACSVDGRGLRGRAHAVRLWSAGARLPAYRAAGTTQICSL